MCKYLFYCVLSEYENFVDYSNLIDQMMFIYDREKDKIVNVIDISKYLESIRTDFRSSKEANYMFLGELNKKLRR